MKMLVAAALAALLCMPGCHRNQPGTAPLDFTLPQVRGGVFHLRAEHPRPVLVAFLQTVPDTADTPSRQQVGFLLSMNHQYSGCGLKVVIVDSSTLVTRQPPARDGLDALINASYDWHLDIPLLEDDDNRVAASWEVTKVPTLVLLASNGGEARRWQALAGPATLAQAIEKVCSSPSGRSAGPAQ
jgi:hypothetical protein